MSGSTHVEILKEESSVRTSKAGFFILLIVLMTLSSHEESWTQAKGSPPVISFAWAQEKIRQGEDWRIYIAASDPDNDMYRIHCRVDQPGGQIYRPDITAMKKGMEGKLTGYLVLRTMSVQDLSGTNLILTVTIIDRLGNESKTMGFPLSINGEGRKAPPPDLIPAGLEKDLDRRIAYIGIDLMRRDRMGGGD